MFGDKTQEHVSGPHEVAIKNNSTLGTHKAFGAVRAAAVATSGACPGRVRLTAHHDLAVVVLPGLGDEALAKAEVSPSVHGTRSLGVDFPQRLGDHALGVELRQKDDAIRLTQPLGHSLVHLVHQVADLQAESGLGFTKVAAAVVADAGTAPLHFVQVSAKTKKFFSVPNAPLKHSSPSTRVKACHEGAHARVKSKYPRKRVDVFGRKGVQVGV